MKLLKPTRAQYAMDNLTEDIPKTLNEKGTLQYPCTKIIRDRLLFPQIN